MSLNLNVNIFSQYRWNPHYNDAGNIVSRHGSNHSYIHRGPDLVKGSNFVSVFVFVSYFFFDDD